MCFAIIKLLTCMCYQIQILQLIKSVMKIGGSLYIKKKNDKHSMCWKYQLFEYNKSIHMFSETHWCGLWIHKSDLQIMCCVLDTNHWPMYLYMHSMKVISMATFDDISFILSTYVKKTYLMHKYSNYNHHYRQQYVHP